MSDNQIQPQAGEFCWNELMTDDPAKAKEFYSALLGWEHNDIDMGDFTYTMFKKGDKELGGMMKTPQEEGQVIPPHWMSYIMVEDVAQYMKKAEELGATVVVPVTPVADFGKLVVLTDPTGATIALWENVKK